MCSSDLDILEEDSEILIILEVPGIARKELSNARKGKGLSVAGNKSLGQERRLGQYYQMERPFGTFTRYFELPVSVEEHLIQTHLDNGLLQIRIPKPLDEQPRKILME